MDPNNPASPMMPVTPSQPVPPAPMPTIPPVSPAPMQDVTVSMNETQTSANSMPPLAPVLPVSTVPTEQIVTSNKKGGGGFIKFFLFLVVVLVLVAGGVGGFLYYNNMTKLSQSPAETSQETVSETEVLDQLQIPDAEISGAPETINYQDEKYGFSIDYLSSWDFECVTCGEIPESTESAWIVMQMQTFDFETDEEDKIVAGAKLIVTARSTENGAETIADMVKQKTGYSMSTYNDIDGALNLDPSQPFQGFIYTDSATGLDIHLEWKSLSNRDRADKELQTILKSFKKI